MALIRFYQKPGCVGNQRQQQRLRQAGHQLEVVDLLSHPWTAETLLDFVAGRPVRHWFNPSAPAIKQGRINPRMLDVEQALALLLAEPLLIRRPLLEIEGCCYQGFDTEQLAELLPAGSDGDLESCPRAHHPCDPGLAMGGAAPTPAPERR